MTPGQAVLGDFAAVDHLPRPGNFRTTVLYLVNLLRDLTFRGA